MRNFGNILTLFLTIFVPVIVILAILNLPVIIQIALSLLYLYCLWNICRNYILTKIMTFNGYYYWYLKEILKQPDFFEIIYSLNYHDHLRLKHSLSAMEYAKVLHLLPASQRQAIIQEQKKDFQKVLFKITAADTSTRRAIFH